MKRPKRVMQFFTVLAATNLLWGTGCGEEDGSQAVCGDGIVNGAEACDGTDLAEATCDTQGFSGGTLTCTNACVFDTSECSEGGCGDGRITGTEACDGSELGGDDCVSQGFISGTLACASNCQQLDTSGCCDHACNTEGHRECQGDTLHACELQSNGCLGWNMTDCTTTGNLCKEIIDPPACAPPCTATCTTDGEASCAQGVLTACADSNVDGCLDLTVTNCWANGLLCDETQAACVANGSGESCSTARYIHTFPARFSGLDMLVDYPGDDHDFNSSASCSHVAFGMSAGQDAVFRVDLEDGDEITAREYAEIDSIVHIVAASPTYCLDTSSCLDSTSWETFGVYYAATGTETVYVVFERYGSTAANDYDFRIQKFSRICGDGHVSPGEVCDDGNTAAGDGCATDCGSIDPGFECQSGVCYPSGSGNICENGAGGPAIPLGPGTYIFDTSGFTNNYDDYNGACGSNMSGSGYDAVFAIDIPDGDVLTITNGTTSTTLFIPVFVLASDCSDITGSCLSWQSEPEELTWINNTGASARRYLVIDAYWANGGVFEFTLDVRTLTCGDGFLDGAEACDDQNTSGGDGCSASCQVEAGNACVGEPSICGAEIFAESFDNWPPTMTIDDGGDPGVTWFRCASSPCSGTSFALATGGFAMVDSDGTGATFDDSLITPQLDFSGLNTVVLTFDHDYYDNSGSDTAQIRVSTDGITYTPFRIWSTNQFDQKVLLDLSYYAGQPAVWIAFNYNADDDYYWIIDSVQVIGR